MVHVAGAVLTDDVDELVDVELPIPDAAASTVAGRWRRSRARESLGSAHYRQVAKHLWESAGCEPKDVQVGPHVRSTTSSR